MSKSASVASISSASGIKKFFDMVKEHDVEYVELRFTDPRGTMHHLSQHIDTIDEDSLKEGFLFDGSSIAGWKAINDSDMLLVPHPETAHLDPFTARPTINLFCTIAEPKTGEAYGRDPRSIAIKAEEYLKQTGIADQCFFGPEAEFFMFDDVRFSSSPYRSFFYLGDEELPHTSGKEMADGNKGHRPRIKGGYFPVAPIDQTTDIRSEMITTLKGMGVPVEKHHHEVAAGQSELGIKFGGLVQCADNMQLYKYVVHNVALAYGKSATFMPKPIFGDNGSGMHVHQSLWKDGKPLFAGSKYAGLSDECLYYIGGLLKHAKTLNVFTNPTTNSYKRLVPGYEAPVLLAYSERNRSASCRIPMVNSPKAKRVELRVPDPMANTYLSFAAMLMAGLDGIKNKIHPGEAMDHNLYELPPEELAKVPTVCRTLREAVGSARADHEFLLQGGVFTKDGIEAYLDLKMEECLAYETMPHPIEYEMYYSK